MEINSTSLNSTTPGDAGPALSRRPSSPPSRGRRDGTGTGQFRRRRRRRQRDENAYQVDITLTYGAPGDPYVPQYPPNRAAGRGRAWYRGGCHLHTVYSDGRNLPGDVAAGARARKLDFMVSTDHNTSAAAPWPR